MTGHKTPTQVCITIDTEFSIGGAFGDPASCSPIGEERVTCPVEGREQGLGFLLDCFAEYGIGATFFVEALQSHYFGPAVMGRIVERILAAGLDVQLHLHPCWLFFRDPDWRARLAHQDPDDRCDGRTQDDLVRIIADGLAIFRAWGVPQPAALRTGSLRVDRTVYDAMAATGLALASNIGIGLFRPADEALALVGGRNRIGNVLELPVMSYLQMEMGSRRRYGLLTIQGTPWNTMESLLLQARSRDISPVVILTHPFEYVKGSWDAPRQIMANRINQARLRSLCEFIAKNPAEFTATSFAEGKEAWLNGPSLASAELRVPLLASLAGMIVNKSNDYFTFL